MDSAKNLEVTESQFYMWRTLFAIAHADHVVSDEEISFMAGVLEDVNFSASQVDILKDDIVNAKDAVEMFQGITEEKDRWDFFEFARDLVWVDGDYGSEEQTVMIMLHKMHSDSTNVDKMVGQVTLELEDDESEQVSSFNSDQKSKGVNSTIKGFLRRFLGNSS